MNILVVEQNVPADASTSELIRGWGYDVESAGTGLGALEMVKAKDIDLILVDIDLQDITAKELIGKIKEISPQIGVITMTNKSADDVEKQIRTLGIIYYMCKPVNTDALKEILDHMERKRLTRY